MQKKIAEKWFELNVVGSGVSQIREIHVEPWLACNIWLIQGRDRDILVDAGLGLRSLKQELPQLSGRPLIAVLSHSHFDHCGGLHEFEDRRGHASEAEIMASPDCANTLADTGYLRMEAFSALPHPGFTPETYRLKAAPFTSFLQEGDVLDLGDRVFRVFHLPGHSPGSLALYEKSTETLFSGDILYDGSLIDNLAHSNAEQYRDSLLRLKELPVRTVHAGHYGSFGGDKMRQVIDEYLAGGRRVGDPEKWVNSEIAKG